MAEVEIRPASAEDIPALMSLDHSCESGMVWQMENGYGDGQIEYRFREIKLPRSLRLTYPRLTRTMQETWSKRTLFLVARVEEKPVGYLTLDRNIDLNSASIADIVVDPAMRRKGIASALVISAQEWLIRNGITRCVLEVPAKNHTAIQFANRLHFELNGFSDNYFPNREMVLYFVNVLK